MYPCTIPVYSHELGFAGALEAVGADAAANSAGGATAAVALVVVKEFELRYRTVGISGSGLGCPLPQNKYLSATGFPYYSNLSLSSSTLRVQAPNNHILTQNVYYNYYYAKPKYLNIGYMGPQPQILNLRPYRSPLKGT